MTKCTSVSHTNPCAAANAFYPSLIALLLNSLEKISFLVLRTVSERIRFTAFIQRCL